jgi:CheY-like chemotaxis protein/class 3 adenylate cyclase
MPVVATEGRDNPRILVVDDAPRNVKLLADLLAGTGYEVVTAGSGAEALECIARERPDLVLLDVVMPGMSGYDVCRAIRDDPGTRVLPVVMVTALEASEERVKGLEAGADDFVSKPIRQPELLARVRSLLRAKRLYDTVEEQAARLAEWNRTLEQRVAEQVAELERLGALKRFLPPQIVERVVAGDADDPLRSHRREIAVVCLELRGFTAFAETSAPEEVMAVLQDHHHAIGRLVVEFAGTLERFTGDGMTVFFNDPIPQPDAAERAVRMALAMRAQSRELAEAWGKRGFELSLGFGIAHGYATLGAIGFEARSDYAAIGTVTHVAARLCEVAEPGEILASQRVLAAVEGLVEIEPAGELALRGLLRPLPAFRVLRERSGGAAAARAEGRESPPSAERVFRREGEYWTIVYGDDSFRLRDSKGLRYVAHLLAHPDREVHVLDLVGIARGSAEEAAAPRTDHDQIASDLGDAGAVLDASAKSAYRERLAELRAELEQAESENDAGRVARLRGEIEFLSQQLAAAVGLGGRDRRVGAAAERARVNVTRAISDCVKRIREHCSPLARHLDGSLRTGAYCAYRSPDPSGAPPWRLSRDS